MVVAASVRSDAAVCPACGRPSTRAHSRHVRRVTDGVVVGRQIVIRLQVRRFFCRNADCVAATFTEQVAGLTEPYRRRSGPMLDLLAQIGLSLAGRVGAQLAAAMGLIVHPTTLVRLVRGLPEPQITVSPEVLGVDDFALKRGLRNDLGGYGDRTTRGPPSAGPVGGVDTGDLVVAVVLEPVALRVRA
ncbi:transposase family protein [Actinoallomurus sp. NPDC050550]|uniref:transposase family protein n=1 Tax=Actinoallomurus sp. NPDC050550 TaxID=3154937 RepID=UPI0033FAF706